MPNPDKSRPHTVFFATYDTLLNARGMALWVLAVLVTSVAGPFGTFSAAGLPLRLEFWGLVVSASILSGYAGVGLARVVGFAEYSLRQAVVGVIFSSMLITLVVWRFFFLEIFMTIEPPTFGAFVGYVVISTTTVAVMRHFLMQFRADGENAGVPSDASEQVPDQVPDRGPDRGTVQDEMGPRLVRRLPEGLDGEILYLSVRDHLVDVVTEAGKVSVRMRFRDAIDEMDGVAGYRVHRSHWVARSAIKGVVRDQARVFLQLPDGQRVPVSRNYRQVLEEAGIL